MVSVGFCVVSTVKRAYPLEDATHIALSNLLFIIILMKCITCESFLKKFRRISSQCVFPTFMSLGTVRRFLENHGENIETVVFAVSDVEEVCAFQFHCYARDFIL